MFFFLKLYFFTLILNIYLNNQLTTKIKNVSVKDCLKFHQNFHLLNYLYYSKRKLGASAISKISQNNAVFSWMQPYEWTNLGLWIFFCKFFWNSRFSSKIGNLMKISIFVCFPSHLKVSPLEIGREKDRLKKWSHFWIHQDFFCTQYLCIRINFWNHKNELVFISP